MYANFHALPTAISQDGRLTTNAFMAEYNQDRFELEIQARETQSPERTTTAKVFVSWKFFLSLRKSHDNNNSCNIKKVTAWIAVHGVVKGSFNDYDVSKLMHRYTIVTLLSWRQWWIKFDCESNAAKCFRLMLPKLSKRRQHKRVFFHLKIAFKLCRQPP